MYSNSQLLTHVEPYYTTMFCMFVYVDIFDTIGNIYKHLYVGTDDYA